MNTCPNPDCRLQLLDAYKEIKTDLYGSGPEGDNGVYGVLKDKVSYRVLSLLLATIFGLIGFFTGFGVNHESRISKMEAMIATDSKIINELREDMMFMKIQNIKHDTKLQEIIELIHQNGK